MKYEIEVVMCTYNGSKYIQKQIESIMNQTLNVNLISIYDDSSSDDTYLILNDLINKYNGKVKIELIRNDKNLGYIENFIQGICKSSSDYIFLCDQDDEWEVNKVESFVDEFLKNSNDIPRLIFSNASLIDGNGKSLDKNLWDELNFTSGKIKSELLKRNVITGATSAINRKLVDLIKKAQISRKTPHDYSIAILALAKGEVISLENKLTRYRIHENNQIGLSGKGITKIINILKKVNGESIKNERTRILDFKKMLLSICSREELLNYYTEKEIVYKKIEDSPFFLCPYICFKNANYFSSLPSVAKLTFASLKKDMKY